MGLAAFNRMRQMEAMKPENIIKENAKDEEKINSSVEAVENKTFESTEISADESAEKTVTRRRRRTE